MSNYTTQGLKVSLRARERASRPFYPNILLRAEIPPRRESIYDMEKFNEVLHELRLHTRTHTRGGFLFLIFFLQMYYTDVVSR